MINTEPNQRLAAPDDVMPNHATSGRGVTTIVRRFPLVSFLALACLFGWSFHIAKWLGFGSGTENLPLGPAFAALIVVACQGRTELRSWARGLRSWRVPPKWYVIAFLAPALIHVTNVLINHAFGAPLPTATQLADWPNVPVTFVLMLVLVGIGEEAGWTLFAAPILLRRHGFVVAWAIAAAMRIFWHLPMMVSGEMPWIVGTVGNAAFTMVTLQVLIATGGRWTPVAIWHASLNAFGGAFFFQMVTGADNARLGYLLAGAYVVVATVAYFVGGRTTARKLNLSGSRATDAGREPGQSAAPR